MIPTIVAILVALAFVALNLSVAIYSGNQISWFLFQAVTVLLVYFGLLAWLLRVERRQPTRRFML